MPITNRSTGVIMFLPFVIISVTVFGAMDAVHQTVASPPLRSASSLDNVPFDARKNVAGYLDLKSLKKFQATNKDNKAAGEIAELERDYKQLIKDARFSITAEKIFDSFVPIDAHKVSVGGYFNFPKAAQYCYPIGEIMFSRSRLFGEAYLAFAENDQRFHVLFFDAGRISQWRQFDRREFHHRIALVSLPVFHFPEENEDFLCLLRRLETKLGVDSQTGIQ